MKKKNRIQKNREFQEIIQKGSRIFSKSFTVYVSNSNFGFLRIGITMSKKIGIAVTRNKIKRQFKSILNSYDYDSISKNIIILVKKEYSTDDFEGASNEIKKSFAKIGIKEKS